MVGSAIVRTLLAQGVAAQSIVTRTHAELDLCNQQAVQSFFAQEKPTQVYLAAAKVGGIHANNTYPADFIYDNLMVQCNVIHAAHLCGVQKLLFLGSSCIYPRLAPQPMREDALLTGAQGEFAFEQVAPEANALVTRPAPHGLPRIRHAPMKVSNEGMTMKMMAATGNKSSQTGLCGGGLVVREKDIPGGEKLRVSLDGVSFHPA